ncbi:Long-chain base-1-phosphate phosphatase [Diplodia seriata]|uniref:Long-chain base-1-phosphate phosphatase n=1 Tax=Diplodia seriata TaxID=420778 RepID=A0ABR3C6V5_9PEZI
MSRPVMTPATGHSTTVRLHQSKLPDWRYRLRCSLIPVVRWETPYLAYVQDALRTPALDSYFAFTANLGTHTFFMIMLPILFWCGYTNLGKAMVHVLASGVFWSGFVKDMLCLPRPLSPPLHRITMSGSAALEYGFPSTHSTNAVSVAVYAIHMLHTSGDAADSTAHTAMQAALYFYAASIVFGRLYCGMHGFLDVIIGTLLGALIAGVEILLGNSFDHWVCQDSFWAPFFVTFVILVLVRIHPEPADDCPCFDDSVCFAGVVIGVEIGVWHFSKTRFAYDDPVPGTVAFSIQHLGWLRAVLRIVLGVFIIFAWRATMKPLLLRFLPPLFRILERLRMNLPRKFFLQASQYSSIANLRDDDHVIPSASEIPAKLNNLRHPRQRTVSIGPQSMADAYETLAYRHQRRRESLNSQEGERPKSPLKGKDESYFLAEPKDAATSTSSSTLGTPIGANLLPTPISSRVHSYEQMMGAGSPPETAATSPITPAESDPGLGSPTNQPLDAMPEDEEKEDREIFSKLERPRVRYDVEVVTKLIVYTGEESRG